MRERFHEREFRGVACEEMIDLFVAHLSKRVATEEEILDAGRDLSINPVRHLRAVRAMRAIRAGDGELPPLQLERAFRLALANGHLWATALRDYWHSNPDRATHPVSLRQINLLAEASEGAIAGLFLIPSKDGSIEHETITKRARWRVAPEGGVTLWISRPACDVLRADVAPDGICSVREMGLGGDGGHAEDPHWWALATYLQALGVL